MPFRPSRARMIAAAVLTLAVAGCALGASSYPAGAPLRPAEDAPDRFVTADASHGAASADTLPGAGCRSPLVDPRDGTRLRMVASLRDVGDYEVPDGRYGVGRGELLRVECSTGRPLGVVRAGG